MTPRPDGARVDIDVRARLNPGRPTIFDEVAVRRADRHLACALVDGDVPAVRLLGVGSTGSSSTFVSLEDPARGDRVACTLDDLEAACVELRRQLGIGRSPHGGAVVVEVSVDDGEVWTPVVLTNDGDPPDYDLGGGYRVRWRP